MNERVSTPTPCDSTREVYQAAKLAQKDMDTPRAEYLFKIPDPLIKPLYEMLTDVRDEPILHLVCNQLMIVIPSVLILYMYNRSHLLGLVYLALNYGLFLQRYMLTLHFTEHRPLFKQRYGVLNLIIPYVMCNFYGVPCGFYRLHHVVMHHVEDNASPGDLTSTEALQRDSFRHFVRYECCMLARSFMVMWRSGKMVRHLGTVQLTAPRDVCSYHAGVLYGPHYRCIVISAMNLAHVLYGSGVQQLHRRFTRIKHDQGKGAVAWCSAPLQLEEELHPLSTASVGTLN
ncbi:hypothetical protein Vretimale_5740 [Volvox reticuliferus]|uniref:Fatty acid desaturase domain-containing protein n=1 Tax=Volvox reticuliferus TaxID=1737510 RepID=A0A8J4FLW0_9CHLO|nr:hypothetical protein Vretifemale_5835 [Volvox reticuliferus]GIM00831.1 hypothetical protein Vretimale_5740 [Volvox reticuliferus]